MRVYMQLPSMEERPPRFCHLFLQQDLLGGWTVVRETGVQGSGGRIKKEHYESREEAETALTMARDAQARRGYRVVFVEGRRGPEA